jgi:hypothetical protein
VEIIKDGPVKESSKGKLVVQEIMAFGKLAVGDLS